MGINNRETHLVSIGGCSPSALAPSQKQSIGVIQMQGTILSITSAISAAIPSNSGGAGLKQMSDNDQVLEWNRNYNTLQSFLVHTLATETSKIPTNEPLHTAKPLQNHVRKHFRATRSCQQWMSRGHTAGRAADCALAGTVGQRNWESGNREPVDIRQNAGKKDICVARSELKTYENTNFAACRRQNKDVLTC